MSAIRLPLSLSCHTGSLLNHGSMPLVGLLNRSVSRLGNVGLIGVDLICIKAIYVST